MVLIWPCVILRRGLWRMLRPLGSVTSEYSDVLVENNPEADHWVGLTWQKLRTTCNSDIIDLSFVRTNSRLHRIISQERPMAAWSNPTSSVRWEGCQEWENYYKSLKREFRYSLRSTRRRLAERGHLSFEAVTDHDQFPPIINWLFSHKTEWASRTNRRTSWQVAGPYQEFWISVAAQREGIGNVIVFVLKFDGRIIAAVLARISKASVEAVIASYDRSYGQYGPGRLLYEEVLRWAFIQNLELDFRIGSEGYKKYWTNRESQVISYRFINSSWGAVFSLASRCRSDLQSLRRKLLP